MTRERKFVFLRGPLFANMILADEINRTPPKTQAALLEAMQEHKITVGGQSHKLAEPFFVLATQNPIEQEGTYPLPEAQLDRFMFMIIVGYPSADEEVAIMKATTGGVNVDLRATLSGEDIIALQDIVRRIPVGDHVFKYAAQLVRQTRPNEPEAPDFVKDNLSWGAGPRASQYLVLGAKARAALYGRNYATTEDVAAVALARPAASHRDQLQCRSRRADNGQNRSETAGADAAPHRTEPQSQRFETCSTKPTATGRTDGCRQRVFSRSSYCSGEYAESVAVCADDQ